jgi:hypothetical protein
MDTSAASTLITGQQYFYLMALNLILVWTLKIVVFIVGYRVVKMAISLLEQGVRGEFKFQGSLQGARADLRSSSPGLLFTLLGTAIIVAALLIKTGVPFQQSVERSTGTLNSPSSGVPPLPKEAPFKSQGMEIKP